MSAPTWCFYFQTHSKSSWSLALSSDRERIEKEVKPELTTMLELNTTLEPSTVDVVKYRGDLVFDLDSESPEDTIPYLQEMLTKLRALGINADALKIFASGKKGFHIIVPFPMFIAAKTMNMGIEMLPAIFKEMACEMYVTSLDLKIYSHGKGRSLRNPNIKRENGKYKVQITADEAFGMTAERYEELISYPRPLFPVESPVFVPNLALIYTKAKDKVSDAIKRKKKAKAQPDVLSRYKGEWPKTLETILAGEGLKPNLGWNFLCIQLAITACALGKTEDQLIESAAGLISHYKGDSSRYGTPKLRERELRKSYGVMLDNPTYDFSVGGVLNLLDEDTRAVTDLHDGEYVSDGTEAPKAEDGGQTNARVKYNLTGIYSMADTQWKRVGEIGLEKPIKLVEMRDGKEEPLGYEVSVCVDGKTTQEVLGLDKLTSRQSFQSWTLLRGVAMEGTDLDISRMANVIRKEAAKAGPPALIVKAEGIDIVLSHDGEFETIYSSPEGVVSLKGNNYRFRPSLDSKGMFSSDMAKAPVLDTGCGDLIEKLLDINTTENMAKLLGWFSASFLTQLFRRKWNKFPTLQVFGQAGAGKSETMALLNHLHYYKVDPQILQSTGQTTYPILCAVASSTSMPVIFEEVKPREMNKSTLDFLLHIFRNNYNGHNISRGGLTKDVASKEATVNKYGNKAPIAFVGEAIEAQAAILERCVIVSLAKRDRYGKEDNFHFCVNQKEDLGRVGRQMMNIALSMDIDAFHNRFNEMHKQVRDSAGKQAEGADRPLYNIAVVSMGLGFLRDCLATVFGDRFDERLNQMQGTLLNNVIANIPVNMSEASRVMDAMAQLTRSDDMNYKLVRNKDYTVSDDGKTTDVKLKQAFDKYVKHCRSLGHTALYDSQSAFLTAMLRYEGVVRKACPDNQALFNNAMEVIYRFDNEYLEKEGCEPFEP